MKKDNLAVIYCRISSEKQIEGFSIDAQVELLRNYAEREGFVVVKEYLTQESAKEAGRKTFSEMIKHVRKNKIPHILTEKTDRWLRNLHDTILTEELIQDGISIHFVKESKILGQNSTSQDMFMFGINAVQAKYYIDNLREEVKKGRRQAALNGKFCHRPPKGYKYDKTTKEIVLTEDAFKIKKLFHLYLEGHSLRDLCKETGLPHTSITQYLRNPFYYGKFRQSGQLYKGKHDPLITEEVYYKVQDLLERKRNSKKRTKRVHRFSGKIRCKICGRVMVGEAKKNGRYTYYVCSSVFEKKCGSKSISEIKLLEFYLSELKTLKFPEDFIEFLQEVMLNCVKQQVQTAKEERANLKTQKTKLLKMIEQTDDLLTQQVIDAKKYKQLNTRYSTQLQEITIKENALQQVNSKQNAEALEFVHSLTMMPYWIQSVDKSAFSEAVNITTRNLWWDGKKLHHDWAELLFPILKLRNMYNLVGPVGLEPTTYRL